jgi:Tyrosine phosphatase family
MTMIADHAALNNGSTTGWLGPATRDLGGLPTSAGDRLRPGLLYRTAAGHDRVPWGVKRAATFRPVWFIDLRNEREIHDETGVPAGVRLVRVPLDDPEFIRIEKASRKPEDYARHYARLLASAGPVAGEALRLTAAQAGPVMVGCQAGKDRTGVVTITLLWALGVTPAAIAGDYLRTARWSGAARTPGQDVFTSPVAAAPVTDAEIPEILVPVLRMLQSAEPAELLQVSQTCLEQARLEVIHG